MLNKDCPCEYCDCNTESMIKLIDPCPFCLIHHTQYDDYREGLGIAENKRLGNID